MDPSCCPSSSLGFGAMTLCLCVRRRRLSTVARVGGGCFCRPRWSVGSGCCPDPHSCPPPSVALVSSRLPAPDRSRSGREGLNSACSHRKQPRPAEVLACRPLLIRPDGSETDETSEGGRVGGCVAVASLSSEVADPAHSRGWTCLFLSLPYADASTHPHCRWHAFPTRQSPPPASWAARTHSSPPPAPAWPRRRSSPRRRRGRGR